MSTEPAVGPVPPVRRVRVEADGGSRGNPGPAAFGALLRDADTGRVLAESTEAIGTASNNVAEYRGLIAGLALAAEHAPDATVEVRMDSKLVVEQMAGRWKVKHPGLRPLAVRAQRLAPAGTTWTWVPRLENADADRLLNAVLDGERAEGSRVVDEVEWAAQDAVLADRGGRQEARTGATAGGTAGAGTRSTADILVGWRDRLATQPTTVVLLRHGVTVNTEAWRFCGSGGTDPGLTDRGREQAARAARWLARRTLSDPPERIDRVGAVDAMVTSPLRRCRETAEIVADELGLSFEVVDDLAEAGFGDWDGLTFEEVSSRWPDLLATWLADSAVRPPGGESNDAVAERASRALAALLAEHRGRTVLVVSHVTPIKTLVRVALDATGPVLHRMHLAPASLTVTQWWPDGVALLRAFSHEPE